MTAGGSSIPEVQALLAVLATGRRVAETGTAYGDGAAAMAATAESVVTVEIDPARAAEAKRQLGSFDNVELLTGDWRELLPERGPFELVFLDAGTAKADPAAAALVASGGLVVMDDLTPGRPNGDPVRAFWFEHPEFAVAEILTTPTTAALIAAHTMRRR